MISSRNNAVVRGLIVLSIAFTFLSHSVSAQQRTRRGFYLSTALGPVFGVINGSDNQGNYVKFEGTGFQLDMQIGGAIKENLIIHGNLGIKIIVNPTINSFNASDDFSISETMIGAGLTRYLSRNIFLTGNIGIGDFSLADNMNSVSTDSGFSFQLKAGKEWWVAKKLALGLVFSYGRTKLTSSPGAGIEEEWNSNRYGVMLNVSFVSNTTPK